MRVHFNSVFWVTAAFLATACGYYRYLIRYGGRTILRLVGAEPLRDQQFGNTIEEMVVAAGSQPPSLYVIEEDAHQPPAASACWAASPGVG